MTGITRFAMVQISSTLLVRSPLSPRVFLPTTRKPMQNVGPPKHRIIRDSKYDSKQVCCLASAISQPPSDAARRGVEEVKKVGNQVKEQVATHAENVANQSKDAAGRVAGAAEDITEKAKKTAQDAWGAAKETAQKVKDNVSEKAEEVVDVAKRKMK